MTQNWQVFCKKPASFVTEIFKYVAEQQRHSDRLGRYIARPRLLAAQYKGTGCRNRVDYGSRFFIGRYQQ
jgi:hypothetical protein